MSLHLDLLRHGQTTGGSGFRGHLDDPLDATGWQQLREAVAGHGPWAAVVSSPLQRCRAFAEDIATARGLALHLEPDLRELGFGDWEGRTAAELMVDQAEALGRFWADPYGFTPPNGEPLVAFERRVLAAIERLLAQHREGPLLVVTHGGVIRLLLARARRLPPARLLEIEAGHAARFRLSARPTADGPWLEEVPCNPC